MSELKTEYEGKIEFTIAPASSKEGQAAAKKYGLGTAKHGLVGFDTKGVAQVIMPGHKFEKVDITDELDEKLLLLPASD